MNDYGVSPVEPKIQRGSGCTLYLAKGEVGEDAASIPHAGQALK